MNLVEIRLDGEVVLAAPILVHDREKARKALVMVLEAGTIYGLDSGTLGCLMKATADKDPDGLSHVGLLIQAVSEPSAST